MGRDTFSYDDYKTARQQFGVTQDTGVTRAAEESARTTGKLNPIVDPAVKPMRFSKIRLDPHNKKWVVTVGCPIDIELSCDTTGSMGGEVDTEMKVLPDLYDAIAKVLPGYDPQLCLGIFGDLGDRIALCRPQFEMTADKIVEYLKEMAPQRQGQGNHGEDPQYAMFARAYLTDAYTNHIGLKGYHFIITDEPYHNHLKKDSITRIFGDDVFEDDLKFMKDKMPSLKTMVETLKEKTHQFVLILRDHYYSDTVELWEKLCGKNSVILIRSTKQLPLIISAIIGLTEGTIEVTDLPEYLRDANDDTLIRQISKIDIGAQAKLRHALPHPVPRAGDIFAKKEDIWPIEPGEDDSADSATTEDDEIRYL